MDGNCHEAVPIFFDATRRNIGEISLYSAQFALTLHPNNIN